MWHRVQSSNGKILNFQKLKQSFQNSNNSTVHNFFFTLDQAMQVFQKLSTQTLYMTMQMCLRILAERANVEPINEP